MFQKTIAQAPSQRRAHYYLGLTYARLGRKDDSAKELEAASRLEHEEAEKQRLGLKIVNPDHR
ncbi:MAG: hypothetical protein ACM3JB_17895 [Acidobacteriaceae bacterium]